MPVAILWVPYTKSDAIPAQRGVGRENPLLPSLDMLLCILNIGIILSEGEIETDIILNLTFFLDQGSEKVGFILSN